MQQIEGALLSDELGQTIHTEFFPDHDLLGVVRCPEPNRFISTLWERSDKMEVPTGGQNLTFWVEIPSIEAMSGCIDDALSHLHASVEALSNA